MIRPKFNADLGEGVGNDGLIMPYLDSCSIACGGHAGDDHSIQETIRLAIRHKVRVGAHPSFPDRDHFGRVKMTIPSDLLIKSIAAQVGKLVFACLAHRVKVDHVKAHGALYNLAAEDPVYADVVLKGLAGYESIPIYAPANSRVAVLASQRGFTVVNEAFADRVYDASGRLVSREFPNSVLSDPTDVLAQVEHIYRHGKVKSNTGEEIDMQGDTFCVHGDNPNASAILQALRDHSF